MTHVIPAPFRMKRRDGAPFMLSGSVPVVCSAALEPLAEWFVAELDVGTDIQPAVSGEPVAPTIQLELVEDHDGIASLPAPTGLRADGALGTVERHGIEIGNSGVRVQASAPEGIFRGLTTLLQLAATGEQTGDEIALPAISILDTPRFSWRGLSLDVVRRAFTVQEVERIIDLLALYKANVLHLHLTDAEGWRIEIDAWPRLAEVGGQTAAKDRPGGYFSKAEYTRIVRYAAERFITIVPEVEMPGHLAAVFRAYPELAGDGVDPATTNLDRSPWFQTLHPDNPKVSGFLTDVLTEVADLTPGAFLHIGGDEALGMDPELYGRIMQQAREVVQGLGKRVVTWQETARTGVQRGDVTQVWLSPTPEDLERFANVAAADPPEGFEVPPDIQEVMAALRETVKVAATDLDKALEQGASILVSLQPFAYLDTKYRELPADTRQANDQERLGMPFYTPSTVKEFFCWEPGTVRSVMNEDHVAGVEAAVWCESVETHQDLLFLVLPRLPGVLEKGWAVAMASDSMWEEYVPRLAAQAPIWDRRGWPYFRSSEVWSGPEPSSLMS